MSAPSRAVMLFGTEEPPTETRTLRAGPLSAELDAGNLRYICYGGREAIRAISYVVRDQYWGTFNPTIENLEIEEAADSFTVTYEAVCADGEQSFRYAAKIAGAADGSLVFEGLGRPVTDFKTNRTGFVVLHPVAGVSGHPVDVLRVDGSREQTEFPVVIDPAQPIMDIRALTYEVAPGVKVTCTMNGDTFEMEDQRNWTDASYKTYVRPLGLPFPYILKAGEESPQSVALSFEATGAAASASAVGTEDTVKVSLGAEAGRVPRFAMGLEARHAAAALEHADSLKHLAPSFLSCYFDARDPGGAEAMAAFKAAGEMLGVGLALEAVVPGEAAPGEELAEVARLADEAGARFGSVAVSPAGDLGFVMPGTVFPDSREFDALYAAAREAFPGVMLGGGTFVYFTELNRKPPPFDKLDFVCHTTCAIVHAADDRSVTETLESLPYVIKSGRSLFGDKGYLVGPGGIGTRSSPFGAGPPPNPENGRVAMTRRDPRQRSLLGAAWHLGYGARMAEGGVDSAILGAPVGAFGLVHHPSDGPQPWYDEHGGLFPSYHVMLGLYAASGAARLATEVSAPGRVQALAYRNEGGSDLWLANLGSEAQTVELAGLEMTGAVVSVLDEGSFEDCAGDPDGFEMNERRFDADRLSLSPYAVARIKT